jgi:hypothetical protein
VGYPSPLDDVLVAHSSYTNLGSLKRRLLAEGILEYRCAECGLSEWRGEKLPLDLDHVNGVSDDNRQENIRLLCPNCHALTPTYRGRNKGMYKEQHPMVARAILKALEQQ